MRKRTESLDTSYRFSNTVMYKSLAVFLHLRKRIMKPTQMFVATTLEVSDFLKDLYSFRLVCKVDLGQQLLSRAKVTKGKYRERTNVLGEN